MPPQTPDPPSAQAAELAEVLRVDQRARWQAGERVPVETYLERFPAVRASAEAAVDLIYAEFLLREARGEQPDPAEYRRRFPAFADVLAEQIALHRALAAPRPWEAPTLPAAGPTPRSETAWAAVPGYEVLGELGRGGMGVVWKARHLGLDRVVALKMVLAGEYAGPADLQRFRAEAEAVARLQHPNVVQVYEVGEHQGLPFFSLEYVDGGSLAQRLDGTPWPARQAASLVETVARAVHAVHERGVVHRDLKPANVLLTADGTPKVTDFGLAKRLDVDKGQTQSGAVVGTPSYMAPEQAQGKGREAGPTTDVYALGAVLYELLTGRPPFKAANRLDTILQVIGEEPVPPSRLQPTTPRDLETICLKCLEKEQQRRYGSALALAEDLRRFLAGDAVRARPTPAWERALKWARRRPAVAALVLVSAVAVLALGVAVTAAFYGAWLHEAKGRAEAEKAKAEEARQAEAGARQRAEMYQYFHHIALAHAGWRDGNMGRVERLLDDCPADLRRWEWHYLRRLANSDLLTLRGHADAVETVAYSPDGTRLASAGRDQTMKVWDATTGRELLTLPGHKAQVNSVTFSPDGQRVASASIDATVKVWDAITGGELLTLSGHDGPVWGLAFSPDGTRLASAGQDSTVKIWDATTGRNVLNLKQHTHWVFHVAYSPDGARLASASHDRSIKFWDAAKGKVIRTIKDAHVGLVSHLAFSPDGARLASCGYDQTVKIWDTATGQLMSTLHGHASQVYGVVYSPDGGRLASAGADQSLRVWDARTGQETLTLKGHTSAVVDVAFSPDGTRLASASHDGTVRLWDATTAQDALTCTGHTDQVHGVTFSPDGSRLASAGRDWTVRLWDVTTCQEVLRLSGHTGGLSAVAFSPDGGRLASVSHDRLVKVWDATTGLLVRDLKGHTAAVVGVAFSPDGTRLASASHDRTVKVWDTTTGQALLTLEGHDGWVWAVAFSPDGTRIASAGTDRNVMLWEAATGQLLRTLPGHGDWVRAVAFSPDGQRLASGSRDGTARVWDATTGRMECTLDCTSQVTSLAFSPDGTRLATAGDDMAVRLWDVASGQEALTLRGHASTVYGVAFSPDGTQLATASIDRTVKVWDARPMTAEASAEREALGLLEYLFARPLRKADVVEHLRGSPTLRPAVRAKALELAARYREEPDPGRYHDAARALVRQRYLNRFQYQLALRQARAACQLAPERGAYLATVGMAQYRLGEHREALATLTQADRLNPGAPADLAFLAMARHGLGEEEQARATLAQVREAVQQPPWAGDEEARAFLGEAEALLRDKRP